MQKIFQKNILSKHPVILALFSGAGGRMVLYRPGMAPIDAPSADRVSIAEIGRPQHDGAGASRRSLCRPRQQVLARLDAGLSQPHAVGARRPRCDADGAGRDNRTILQNNIAFMDECVAKGVIPFATLEAFGKKQAPYLAKNVAWAAQTQVAHWMTVLADWKAQLGADWDKTYAASNTIYVARQNNVLFSVLAQFFGPDAINNRLLLIETISFTTTPADMLESLTRIIADRSVRSAVLRQLPPDGLRADGRRCARRDHRRDRQARHDTIPAARRSLWLGSGRHWSRRGRGLRPSPI